MARVRKRRFSLPDPTSKHVRLTTYTGKRAPSMQKAFLMPVGALMRRHDFNVVKALFEDYDADHDGRITQKEFIDMTLLSRFEDLPNIHPARRTLSQVMEPELRQHWRGLGLDAKATMDLPLLLGVFFPQLRKRDIKRIIEKYAPSRTERRSSQRRLSEAQQRELNELFDHWDLQHKGFLTWDDLDVPLERCGVGRRTAKRWLAQELSTSPRHVPERLGRGEFQALFHDCYPPAAAAS